MAYDAATGEVVMFSGSVQATAFVAGAVGDTWVWDGTDWADRTALAPAPSLAPPPSDPTRSVTVSPTTQTANGGDAASVTAHVVDALDTPVGGVSVVFTRTGSNPGTEQGMTDPSGNATHTYVGAGYVGAGEGWDVVTAKAQGSPAAVGASAVRWRHSPAATGVVFDPPVVQGPRGEARDVEFKVLDEEGRPLPGATVHYGVQGAGEVAAFSATTAADAEGRGAISVTPEARPLQVVAYADEVGGQSGSREPTETLGSALVVGTTDDPAANEPPGVPALVAPAEGATWEADHPQTFSVRASDPDAEPFTAEIAVTNTGTNATTVFSTAPADSGRDATGAPFPPLAPGSYVWSAVARDARGLEGPGSGTRAFTVMGNRPPTVPALVAPDHDERFTLEDPQRFAVSSTDPDDDPYSATITVRNASGSVVKTFTTTLVPQSVDSTGTPVPALAPGSYTWTAKAKDARGAESSESEPRSLVVGNLPPTVPTLLSPTASQTLSSQGPQAFAVSSTDPDGDAYSATVTVRNASSGSVVQTFSTAVASPGEDSTGAPVPSLGPGSYTWTAKAKDAYGAESGQSEARAFNVSLNRAPEVPALVSPRNGEALYVDKPQLFTIQATDPEGAPYTGTVTITNTGATTSFATSAAPSGAQSVGSPTVPLLAGNYTWRATATDAFGVTGPPSASRSFTVALAVSPLPAAPPAAGPMTRASMSDLGGQPNNWALYTSMSADGRYVAFSSSATNLVPLIDNGRQHIFVRDRMTGVTEAISVTPLTGFDGNNDSWAPSISADGRYVAFESYASNLVSADTNGHPDVFVRDRITKETMRVSVSTSGAQSNGGTWAPSISADGRYVAFVSGASNLVSGDTNGVGDIFVRDRITGITERASVSSSEAQGTPSGIWWGYVGAPSMSGNGRYVAFSTAMIGLVSGDSTAEPEVFLRDRVATTTQRVAVSSSGAVADSDSFAPSVSGDGRYVAFLSDASNLAGGGNGRDQVYVRDRSAGTTQRISASPAGVIGNDWSGWPAISADGRYVVFTSDATNLIAGDRNGEWDVFLRDRSTTATTLVSHSPDGLQANGDSSWANPSISSDGLHVAFISSATNLVSGDTNGELDLFAYNRQMSLDCAGGSISAVGCLSGYGFKAASSKTGLEDFYPYHPFDLGSDQALLNVHNGNLVVHATDLEVGGQGLNLRLTRTYNSQWDRGPGPLGRGWRLGLADGEGDDLLGSVVSAALSADVGQLLEVVATEDQFDFFDADGTRHHFVKGGLAGPGWHSPPGVNLTLSDYLVGGERRYRAVRPDGVTYEFRPVAGSYGLVSIADRKGNTLTFAYSSGRLSSITDTSGRTITFVWSGDYLSSATFSGSGSTRTVNYSVDSGTGRLTSVSTAGRTVSYTYRGSESSDGEGLATATDGRGGVTTFFYNGDAGTLAKLRDRASKDWNVAFNTTSCQPGSQEAAVATCITDPEGGVQTYVTSAEGNLLQVRDAGSPAANSRSYPWEANRLVWESDEVGNATEYAYNKWGQVVLKRESGGSDPLTSVFAYREVAPGVSDLVGMRSGVGSGDERVWRFGLAENGDTRSVTDPEGNVTTFAHYQRGLLKSVTDARGNVVTYGNTAASDGGYHPTGQPPSITDQTGEITTFSYDFLGHPTSSVDRNGNTWSFGYDARGNLTSQSVPGGGTTTYAYDLNDNQTSATPPGGATTTSTFDARDLPTAIEATIGGTLRKSTDAYDDAGRLVEIKEPRTFAGSPTVTQKVTYEYFANGRAAAMIDEEGKRTDLTYTPDGNLLAVQRPAGNVGRHTTTYTYNRRDQVTSVLESGHAKPTTHRYGVHGERLTTTSPKGSAAHFAYDKVGRLTRTTDANGKDSKRTYDEAGNLLSVTQPVGDGGAITTSYSYTARGEIASESDPSDGAHTITYEYDDAGRQRFRRDRYYGTVERSLEQTYRADGAVLSSTATATDRPTHQSTFSYDAAGNATAANASLDGSQVSALSISYNNGFEPTSVSETLYPPSGPAATKTVSYTYQPDGLLASRTVDGNTTNYTHTLAGREASTVLWGGGSASSRTMTQTYLSNGAPSTTQFPNGARATHTYDAGERLGARIVRNSSGSTTLSSWETITYDENDDRIAETVTQGQLDDALAPLKSGQANYAYDALGRLTSAKHPFDAKTATFELDDAGNVIHETGETSQATYLYYMNRLGTKRSEGTEQSPEGPSISYAGQSSYSYDHLGDLTRAQETMRTWVTIKQGNSGFLVDITSSNITTTSYDAASHTKRVQESDGSYVDYTYDALGRQARRVEHPAEGADTVTLFFHDGGSSSVALETDASGSVKTRYLLASAGDPFGAEDTANEGARSYLVSDPRGNVTQLLGQDQGVKAVFGYDPFGKDRPSHSASAEGWDSRLRFQTAPKDPKTGAYALGARLYDPSINRFASADHYAGAAANMDLATDPLTGNRYLYAGANPAGMIDDGHSPQWFYSSSWHPGDNWYVQAFVNWWVSWRFETSWSWNQYKPEGYDVHHQIRTSFKADTFVYIRFDLQQGACASCWKDFNAGLTKEMDEAYRAAVRDATAAVKGAFARYVKAESWRWTKDEICGSPITNWAIDWVGLYPLTTKGVASFAGTSAAIWGVGKMGARGAAVKSVLGPPSWIATGAATLLGVGCR